MIPFAGATVAAFAGVLVWCAWSDIGQRRIANSAVVALLALYLVAVVLDVLPGLLTVGLICAGAVFAVGLIGFAAHTIGGGDVKLAAALGLWAGSSGDLAGFVLVTALAGAALSMLILATRNVPFAHYLSGPLQPGPQTGDRAVAGESVPYGVALAAGGLWIAYGLVAG